MYNPGALDQLIAVFRRVRTPDDYGGEEITEQELFRAWALVKPMSGSEKKEHERMHDTSNYRFVIRNHAEVEINALKEDDFIVWGNQKFNIRFLAHKGPRKLYLEINAERNAQG